MVTIYGIGSVVAPDERLGTVMTLLASGVVARLRARFRVRRCTGRNLGAFRRLPGLDCRGGHACWCSAWLPLAVVQSAGGGLSRAASAQFWPRAGGMQSAFRSAAIYLVRSHGGADVDHSDSAPAVARERETGTATEETPGMTSSWLAA